MVQEKSKLFLSILFEKCVHQQGSELNKVSILLEKNINFTWYSFCSVVIIFFAHLKIICQKSMNFDFFLRSVFAVLTLKFEINKMSQQTLHLLYLQPRETI